MHITPRIKSVGKLLFLVVLTVLSGTIGAALASRFGTSSTTISYVDFISVILTALGVMLTAVTLFVGVLAVIGWTSIEARLRDHSVQFIGSELQDDKPLGLLIRKAVRDAVYEGVAPREDDTAIDAEGAPEEVAQ